MAAIFRALFGYCFLVLVVRIVGRRPGKQMTPFDFVLIFFMGGITLTGIVGDDRSITNALCAIATIGMAHVVLGRLRQKSQRFGRVVDGTPLLLLGNGKWRPETMKNMALIHDDVMAAGRDKGLERLEQIRYAVLERNGEISIIQNSK